MTFVIATHNAHKADELARILQPLGIEAATGEALGLTLSEPEENGTTFAQNAAIKAQAACFESGLPAIADDSGLMVDALDGEPGVYSARYAPVGQRKKAVLQKLDGLPDEKRRARFVSAVCCAFPNGDMVTAEGVCEGRIGRELRGEGGFGYDPIFIVQDGEAPENGKTFAQLSPQEKDRISHRGRALRVFARQLEQYLATTGEKTRE